MTSNYKNILLSAKKKFLNLMQTIQIPYTMPILVSLIKIP